MSYDQLWPAMTSYDNWELDKIWNDYKYDQLKLVITRYERLKQLWPDVTIYDQLWSNIVIYVQLWQVITSYSLL